MKNYILFLFVFISIPVLAQVKVSRLDLLLAVLNNEKVSKVEVKKIVIPIGLVVPKHLHPCPVVGYVVSGKVLFQIEGEAQQILKPGDAFYEPKNKTVLHFDNASKEEDLTFVAFYLRQGDEELIKLLD